MDANGHEFVGKVLFDFRQLRKQMQAVNSAIRPEIEDNDLAAQIRQGEWPVGVVPLKIGREFGRANRTSIASTIGHRMPPLQSDVREVVNEVRFE
jgi:hypothetical protein